MNRLTERTKDGIAYTTIPLNESNIGFKCYTGTIAERIAAYEDTGLEPEEIKQAYDMYLEVYSKVSEYADLTRQGRLIKLPCRVGDIVYEANKGRKLVAVYKVTSVTIMTHSRNYGWELIEGIYSNVLGFNEFALGKTVFLTREEAEKALEAPNAKA